MTDTKKLREAIARSGLKIEYIAEQAGMSGSSLRNKLSNRTDFTASEIACLARLLNLEESDLFRIFFCI